MKKDVTVIVRVFGSDEDGWDFEVTNRNGLPDSKGNSRSQITKPMLPHEKEITAMLSALDCTRKILSEEATK